MPHPSKVGDGSGGPVDLRRDITAQPPIVRGGQSQPQRQSSRDDSDGGKSGGPPAGPTYNEALKAALSDAMDGAGDDESAVRSAMGRPKGTDRSDNETEDTDVKPPRAEQSQKGRKQQASLQGTGDITGAAGKTGGIKGASAAPLSRSSSHDELQLSIGPKMAPGEIGSMVTRKPFGSLKNILSSALWMSNPQRSKSLNDLQTQN